MNRKLLGIVIMTFMFILLMNKKNIFSVNNSNVTNDKSMRNNNVNRKYIKEDEYYKSPGVRLDKKSFSNNCIPSTLYPINQLDVDYGSKIKSDCPCLIYTQSY